MAPATAQGTLLKSTREARGISLRVVHEATKIPMDVLRAIEEGYTVRTLAPFYLQGFIKMYAEYLKINVRDIHIEERKQERPAVSVPKPRVAPPPPSPIETLDLEQWFAGVFTHRRKQQIAILAVAFIAFFFFVQDHYFFTHKRPKPVVKAQIKRKNRPSPRAPRPLPPRPRRKTADKYQRRQGVRNSCRCCQNVSQDPSAPVPSLQPPQGAFGQASAPTAQLDREIMLTVRAKKTAGCALKRMGSPSFNRR